MPLIVVYLFWSSYNWVMNAEHQALAEYLEQVIEVKLESKLEAKLEEKLEEKLDKKLDKRFKRVDEQFNEVNRRIDALIYHVDKKNDQQDGLIDEHDLHIRSLVSDMQVLTS